LTYSFQNRHCLWHRLWYGLLFLVRSIECLSIGSSEIH
jgi:hypothetical protein